MKKHEIIAEFDAIGVKVLRVAKFYNTFRVTVSWRDALKIPTELLVKYEIVQK